MMKLINKIKSLTDAELIEICNSIWDWKYDAPREESSYAHITFYNNNKELFENSISVFNNFISAEAFNRYSSLVKYLITTDPYKFIK